MNFSVKSPNFSDIVFRQDVKPSDPSGVRLVVSSSGFFSSDEIEIAVDLVEEALSKGLSASGYYFLFAERAGKLIGYACFGPIPCTDGSYDLYWIAVCDELRRSGLGKELLRRCESLIEKRGGRRIYVETSSKAEYYPTQNFYKSCGYLIEAILEQFYSPNDDKIIFVKVLH